MRVLTVRQPWASLIIDGPKKVENRCRPFPSTLPTPARIWIHAAQLPSDRPDGWAAWDRHVGHGGSEPDHYGAILGTVEVTGHHHAEHGLENCVRRVVGGGLRDGTYSYCSRWAEPNAYHWTLAAPVPLAEPIPAKGRLGLWRPDDQLAAQLEAVTADA